MAYLIERLWTKHFKNWLITDCAVREHDVIYLCLRKNVPPEEATLLWDHDIHSKLFGLSLAPPVGEKFGASTFDGFNRPRVGVSRKPLRQGLLVANNNDGQVDMMGAGVASGFEYIGVGQVPATKRVKCINDYAYSVGLFRSIYKRVEAGKWVKIDEGFPKVEASTEHGFNDLDAFHEQDMYAVGGRGDVWHFDGHRWSQMDFPGNLQLATVTCAGDGFVYISGEGGSIWRGRESSWELVYKGGSSIMWNDVLWHEDKLWLASDYQFRIWDGVNMLRPTYDGTATGEPVPIYGHMDCYGGLLIVASPDVVMAYQNKQWRTLIAPC